MRLSHLSPAVKKQRESGEKSENTGKMKNLGRTGDDGRVKASLPSFSLPSSPPPPPPRALSFPFFPASACFLSPSPHSPLSSAEVQWSVRAEPLSGVSGGTGDESGLSGRTTSVRYLRLHSFCSAVSFPPKAPLEPLRRREPIPQPTKDERKLCGE